MLQRGTHNQLSLVQSAFAALARVQRNRHRLCVFIIAPKLRDRLSQASWYLRRGKNSGVDRVQALFANRKPGNLSEGKTTDPAIGGKCDRKNAADYGHPWRNEEGTLLGALHSSLSV
jgi:hypothetical protein